MHLYKIVVSCHFHVVKIIVDCHFHAVILLCASVAWSLVVVHIELYFM